MTIGKPDRVVYIVASPRSGTTWLQTLLGSHPDIASTVELTLYTRFIAPLLRAWEEEQRILREAPWDKGIAFHWDDERFLDWIRELVWGVYDTVRTNDEPVMVDKNPSYALHIDDIVRIVPDARFIHLVRDGRDVVSSMMAARRSMGFGPGSPEGAARMWARHLDAVRAARLGAEQLLEVRYEDLLANGEDELARILSFIGLPADVGRVRTMIQDHSFERMRKDERTPADVKAPKGAYRKGRAGSWTEDLSVLDRYLVDRIAGPWLRELGYAERNWWGAHAPQRWAVATLGSVMPTRFRVGRRLNAVLAPSVMTELTRIFRRRPR